MSIRSAHLHDFQQTVFDVLIVGGGINGAVSAASLSHHGYKIALIDQGDFASQTSQASSNLIWGGIKYMENYEFSLVSQLCHSRNELMEAFPSLIQEVRFFLPIDSTAGKGNWKHHPFFLFAGMWLYWLLGRFHTRPPRYFFKRAFRRTGYPLNRNRFQAALEYSDAYLPENDSRLVYRFIKQAQSQGGVVQNYLKFIGWKKRKNLFITIEDQLTKKTFIVETRFLINATGPFIDGINHCLKVTSKYRHVFSKGIHLIFPRIFSDEKVISFFDEDDRLFFAIPMGNRTVVGTTDTRVEKPEVQVSDEDRNFLLRNINRFLDPNHQLSHKDILSERCGVRPLVVKSKLPSHEKRGSWFHLSRKHVLEFQDRILSIFGGKLTDCINIGKEVTEKMSLRLRLRIPNEDKPERWYGEEFQPVREKFESKARSYLKHFPELKKFLPLWWARYGSEAEKILQLLEGRKKIIEIYESGYTDVELLYIIWNEQVVTWEDLFRRRTKLELVIKKSDLMKHPAVKKIIKDNKLSKPRFLY